jgi:uncharacterized protein YdaT
MSMQKFDQAITVAGNKVDKWAAIENELKEIREKVIKQVGEGAISETDKSHYSDQIEITIKARIDSPQDGALRLMEMVDWDSANIRQKRSYYELRVEKRVRGH